MGYFVKSTIHLDFSVYPFYTLQLAFCHFEGVNEDFILGYSAYFVKSTPRVFSVSF